MVIFHLNLGKSRHFLHEDATHARHTADEFLHLLRLLSEHLQVIAEDLDRHVLFDARQQLVVAHLDGLRDFSLQARYRLQRLLHLLHQFLGGLGGCPLCLGFECHHDVCTLHGHRVGGNLGTTYAAHHLFHLGELCLQKFLCLGAALHHLRERRTLYHTHLDGEIALLQGRDELATQELESHATDTEERHGTGDDILAQPQHPIKQGSVPPLQFGDDAVGQIFLGMYHAA